MTEDDLRQFDKEVLVQFIFADSVFSRERTLVSLRHYEKRLRVSRLTAQIEAIGEQLRNFDFSADMSQWDALFKKKLRIQKKLNKILGE